MKQFRVHIVVLWTSIMLLEGCGRNGTGMSKQLETEQLIVVTTPDWAATSGWLTAYQWTHDQWVRAIEPVRVTVGRNGMAWGVGVHGPRFNEPPLKKEGDGKSPAGIFPLISLYGYGELEAKLDYLKVDPNTFCVDDPESRYYNQIVRGDEVEKDWSSAETMRMQSDAYKYGIVVGYNTGPVEPGAGSCIFLHLGEPDGITAGCTAMAEADMLKLIRFLDKTKKPVIVQAPEAQYQEMSRRYLLPRQIR